MGRQIDHRAIYLKQLTSKEQNQVEEIFRETHDFRKAVLKVTGISKETPKKNYVISLEYGLPKEVERVSVHIRGRDGHPAEYRSAGLAVLTGMKYCDLYEQVSENKDKGAYVNIKKANEFDNADIFGIFPDYMYESGLELKKEGRPVMASSIKTIRNALHGWFDSSQKDIWDAEPDDRVETNDGKMHTVGELINHSRKLGQRRATWNLSNGNLFYVYPKTYRAQIEHRIEPFRFHPAPIGKEEVQNAHHLMWKDMDKIARIVGWKHLKYVNTVGMIWDVNVLPHMKKKNDGK